MRAAMTGHLVITTIYTEDAVSAIDRLKDMACADSISAGLRGIISQRLLRRICPHCKENIYRIRQQSSFLKSMRIPAESIITAEDAITASGSGYRGRIGTFEVLNANDRFPPLHYIRRRQTGIWQDWQRKRIM